MGDLEPSFHVKVYKISPYDELELMGGYVCGEHIWLAFQTNRGWRWAKLYDKVELRGFLERKSFTVAFKPWRAGVPVAFQGSVYFKLTTPQLAQLAKRQFHFGEKTKIP